MNVEINNTGGTVIISDGHPNPPKQWIKKWRMFGLFFAVSNGRLKKRPWRDIRFRQHGTQEKMCEIKGRIYKRNGGKCPHCGKEMDIKGMELHHVLPWGRFPEYRMKAANLELLCHKCHNEIHVNPFLNIQMMKAKAEEFGIDLKDRYDYDKADQDNGCEDYTPTAD